MLKKWLKYASINGTYCVGLWYGFVEQVVWVSNLTTLYIWIISVLSVLAVILLSSFIVLFRTSPDFNYSNDGGRRTVDDVRRTVDKLDDPSNVAKWIYIVFNVCVMVFLGVVGHLFLSGLSMIVLTCHILVLDLSDNIRDLTNELVDNERRHRSAVDDYNPPNTYWETNKDSEHFGNSDLFRMGIINEQGEDDE